MRKIAVVFPCYNEGDIINKTFKVMNEILEKGISEGDLDPSSFMLFVDDGSSDDTFSRIESLPLPAKGLSLIENKGQEFALLEGIRHVSEEVEWIVTMDVDLQDDISVLPDLFKKMTPDLEALYGVRSNRDADSFLKKFFASGFYRTMQALGIPVIKDHAHYRVISTSFFKRITIDEKEPLFLRLLFPLHSRNSEIFYYIRKERISGETKYSYLKMFRLAWEGVKFGWKHRKHI